MCDVQDLEHGVAERSEKSFLLPSRRTSSVDEDLKPGSSRTHSRGLPQASQQALGITAAPEDEASTSGSNAEEQSTESSKMKGLGLAGISTVFQAVMSVCAKILGKTCETPQNASAEVCRHFNSLPGRHERLCQDLG